MLSQSVVALFCWHPGILSTQKTNHKLFYSGISERFKHLKKLPAHSLIPNFTQGDLTLFFPFLFPGRLLACVCLQTPKLANFLTQQSSSEGFMRNSASLFLSQSSEFCAHGVKFGSLSRVLTTDWLPVLCECVCVCARESQQHINPFIYSHRRVKQAAFLVRQTTFKRRFKCAK